MMIEIERGPFRAICINDSNRPSIYKKSEWLLTKDEYIVNRVLRHSFCGHIYYELYVERDVQQKLFSACRFRRNDIYSVN